MFLRQLAIIALCSLLVFSPATVMAGAEIERDTISVNDIGGTTNQVTVTDDGDGTVTLSTPQDTDTGADVTFNSLTGDGSGLTSVTADSATTATTLNSLARTDDNALVANGTVWQGKALPDCDDSGGKHLNYDTATNAYSCGTSGGAATGVCFDVHRNGVDQENITNNTETKINWTTEKQDTNNLFTNDSDDSGGATESRLTVDATYAGQWWFFLQVRVSTIVDQMVMQSYIRYNGVANIAGTTRTSGTAEQQVSTYQVLNLSDGDYVDSAFYHAKGDNTPDIQGNIVTTRFMGCRIGG